MPALTAELIPSDLTGYLLVLARLSPIIMLMPGIGERAVPVRVRAAFLLATSLALSAAGVGPASAVELQLARFLELFLIEFLIGACFAVLLRLSVWILEIAGSIIAQSIGLAQFMGVGMGDEISTIFSNLLRTAGIVILLTLDFPVLVLDGFVRLYATVETGQLNAIDPSFFLGAFFKAIQIAVQLSWPLVAINLLYNVCLGFMNRALPQLMVAFVGAPLIVGTGLAFFAIAVASLLTVWRDEVILLVGWL